MSANATNPELHGINTYVVVIVCVLADTLNILNNVIIIFITYRMSGIKEVSGVLICNQALADIGVGVTFMVYSCADAFHYQGHTIFLALGWMRIFAFIFYSESMQMLAAIACNLCFAICRAHDYAMHITIRRVCVLIFLTWMINIALSLLDLSSDTFNRSRALPHMFLADQNASDWWIIALDLTTLLVIPLGVAIVSFVKIFQFARTFSDLQNVNSRTTRHIRHAMCILVIGIIYMLTFLPVVVTQMVLKSRTAASYGDSVISLTALFINYAYMALKLPLLLALFRSYRESVTQILCCSNRRVHDVNEMKVYTSNRHLTEAQQTDNSEQ
ncbi:adenosine receptor A3-like [Haliotis cracherodii]|uniref:adenosine receptor A3-like n=1 Tax=Haliotis cracherodii TaxID=6455 RepID=UPI0039EB906D